jgi:hypothetical protein
MPFDFNSFDSAGNAFRDSGFNARGRNALFLHPFYGDSAGDISGFPDIVEAINFPAGISGDSIQFYAFSPSFPLPSFRWGMQMGGDPDEGWGRKSFTIRYWWRAGREPDALALGSSIHGQFRTAYDSTYFVQPNMNSRAVAAPVGLATIVDIPTIRFGVWTGAAFEEVSFHFFQSPETRGGSTIGLPTGGIVGPLIEMTEDTWHRTIVWYDEDTLEIGLQLDNLTPVTATLTAPIPAGSTQGLQVGENTPWNNFDYGFDEYGLWHDYVWTGAERAADWNAGAGIGWPGVLGAISRQPMAYFRFEDPDDLLPEGVASMI